MQMLSEGDVNSLVYTNTNWVAPPPLALALVHALLNGPFLFVFASGLACGLVLGKVTRSTPYTAQDEVQVKYKDCNTSLYA
jgi:hypothetical protein